MFKRIAVDVRSLATPHSGIGRYTQRLLEHLSGLMKDSDVEWFFYSDRPFTLPLGNLRNVTIRDFSRHNKTVSLIRSQVVFSYWARMDSIDAFWSPRHHLPVFLDTDIHTIVTIHDMVWRTHPETMKAANRMLERVLMPVSLNRASAIIAVSNATRIEIVQSYPLHSGKITVVHEAADPPVETISPDYTYPYFLFVSTFEPRKNLKRILAAIEKSVTLVPEHFVFVGGAGWGIDLQFMVSELSDLARSRCHFIGNVSEETLHAHYVGATAHIMVSLSEGFGLPALEAMSHSVPVIVSNRSAFPEVVGEGGIYVNPLNVNEISAAIVKLSNDKTYRQKLAELAQLESGKFSWEKAARETMQVFAALDSVDGVIGSSQ